MATIFTDTLTINDPGNHDYSYRCRYPVTGNALDQIRVTFEAHDSLPSWVDNVGIGIWDGSVTAFNAVNCTGVPSELLFSTNGLANGGHGFHLVAGGTIASDWLNFAGFTTANSLIIIVDFASTNGNGRANNATATGAGVAYVAATNSYNIQNQSTPGVATPLAWSYMPRLVETQGVAAPAATIGIRSRIQLGH